MSTNQVSHNQNLENDRIIEQWMKSNKSGQFIVESNKIKEMNRQTKMQNERRSLPAFSFVTKKDDQSSSATKVNVTPNKLVTVKRTLAQAEIVPKKIVRWSSSPKASPIISIQLEPVNKTVTTKPIQQSTPNPKPGYVIKRIPTFLQTPNSLTNKTPIQSSQSKTSVPTKKVIIRAVGKVQTVKNGKNHNAVIKKKNTNFKNTHLKLKDNQDVYSSVQDNYKNLYMPDNWSTTEFAESDSNQQCIVFSKPHVVRENDTLVTVMQKSLIIDKGGTMHYSVYSLPVDGTGTILPNVLDNVKKLLSIVHIFDKMQVCKGLGDDLLIVKTDNLIKDVCQVWRHVSCKLLLVKADQCQTCLDARNILLEKEMLFKSEVLSADCVNHFMAIKEEHD